MHLVEFSTIASAFMGPIAVEESHYRKFQFSMYGQLWWKFELS